MHPCLHVWILTNRWKNDNVATAKTFVFSLPPEGKIPVAAYIVSNGIGIGKAALAESHSLEASVKE